MADINLDIKYSDAGIERLEADLKKVKDTAVRLQNNLDLLEKKFQSVGKVAMLAFGRGLQTRITTITKRIGGQREAVKSLIHQYALLAAAQRGVGGGKATTSRGTLEAWKKSQGAGWHADDPQTTKPGIHETPKKTDQALRNLSMVERRASLAKDLVKSEMTTAQLAEKYGKSQTTIRRDKKAIAEQNMKNLTAERKLLASAATPFQRSISQAIPPPQGRSLALPPKQTYAQEIAAGQQAMIQKSTISRERQQRMLPITEGTLGQLSQPVYGPPLPPSVLGSQTAVQRMAQTGIPKTPRQTVQGIFSRSTRTPELPKTAEAYQSLGKIESGFKKVEAQSKITSTNVKKNLQDMWTPPTTQASQTVQKMLKDSTPTPTLPKTAKDYESLGRFNEIENKSKITSKNVKDRMTDMWSVPDSAAKKATKPVEDIQKKAQGLGKTGVDDYQKSIKSAKKELGELGSEYENLIKKQFKASKEGKAGDVERYGEEMKKNYAKQQKLDQKLETLNKNAQNSSKKRADVERKASKERGNAAETVAKKVVTSNKKVFESTEDARKAYQDAMNLSRGKPADKTGDQAQKNAEKIDKASKKTKEARKSEAQTFDDYSKRYQHAQGRVDAAIGKATKNLSLIPRTSKHYQAQANALGELRNLSRGLGSEKNQADAFKKYTKDADRLFDTIQKGAKQSKKHVSFMNKTFAKVSIAMSGIAATLFVWQQVSAAIGAVVRNFTNLEKALINAQMQTNMSAASLEYLEQAARKAGKTGVTTADKYAAMVAQLQRYGMSATGAIESVNAELQRHEKILEKTLGLQISRFFNLMKETGYIAFGSNADDMTASMERMNDQIQKTVESQNDTELAGNVFESLMKSADAVVKWAIVNPIIWSVSIVLEPWANLLYDAAAKLKGELDKVEEHVVKKTKSMSYRGQIKDRRPPEKEPTGYLQPSHVIKLQKAHESIDTTPVVNSMSYLDDAFEMSSQKIYYTTKSIEDYQALLKEIPKDLLTASKVLGKFTAGTKLDKEEKLGRTLRNIAEEGVLTPEEFKEVEDILTSKLQMEELNLRLPDYRKFYSTLRRYSDAYYDAELKRIKQTHTERLSRAQTPQEKQDSTQIAQKEFRILERRKAAPFMSSEKKLLETLGITSGTKIEVGIAFDEKTGKVTATKMMTYLDLLNYNSEQAVKAINANLGKIGRTVPKAFQSFESKGGAEITKIIQKAAKEYDLDPHLIEQVIQQESRFRPDILSGETRSKKGAIGAMQLMPSTAKDLGVDPFNIEENIMGGADYLKQQLDRFSGDLKLALAAYNAGPGAVQKYGNKVPPYGETQDYVAEITQRYGSQQMRQPQMRPREDYDPRVTVQESQTSRQASRIQDQLRKEIFKNTQMPRAHDQRIYKKAYAKLGTMTQEFYSNQLDIINNFEKDNAAVLGPVMAKRIADKARFNLDWQKKTADELKISEDGLRMLEKVYSETDIYSPKLQKQGELKIQETEERLAKTPVPKHLQRTQIQTMELKEYQKINKLKAGIDQEYFNESKVMTDFLYNYKKQEILKQVAIMVEASKGTLDAEQILKDKLQALDDEHGKNRVDAWKAMYDSTGKYSTDFANHEIAQLARIREQTIRVTKDVDGAWEAYRRDKTKIEIEVALKSEDAMAGLEALRMQTSLETKTMAEKVNENLKTIVDGTKENFAGVFYDTMQGEITNVWDLFTETGDRFKEMIDRMVSDYLASQLAQGLFGDMMSGGSGGGALESILGTVIGGFGGGSTVPELTGRQKILGMAKGGVINKAMNFTNQQVINKSQTFKSDSMVRLAKGGVINKPLVFGENGGPPIRLASGGVITTNMMAPYSSNSSVEIGEAGPEVIMPISRTKSGKMGVQVEGGGGKKVENHFHIKVEAPNGRIDPQSMNQMQTKLGMAVNRSLRRNG